MHLHSGIQFVSPAQCHEGLHIDLLKTRQKVCETARDRNPEHWSGGIRNWNPHQFVALNLLKENQMKEMDPQ